ncbi:uncharacterized protein YdhG (YjbR/CyaY superfamily) [Arcticibacter pallidicorallinus]|uniref:Uncharacterized protein YdhG (YjbR/CyaY superfamily) n=1 Tax=Arcticibacter pallidicorallinus TaxID=1259464 RepID=A0A2T0UBA9_9SPHI|nr:DUF1801 domain-containing protein [Arcticibacter pallidicorallinus]PRY55158.1 uncharacterized protein YdhG (YjbR/CyaY superfamily) [Arcticibacter pallidicorallinus]
MDKTFNDTESYISSFPENVRLILQQLRSAIKEAAPEAEETIKYDMPTYVQHGNLVHFAAYRNHIGFYATPTGHAAFEQQLSGYKSGKGSVQFPIEEALPLELVKEIVRFRVLENKEKIQKKKNLRVCKKGHQYYKSSDCPICPICEKESERPESFLSFLSAPARRALESKGIGSEETLSQYKEKEILQLHGLGKTSLPPLREALSKKGLSFKE